LVLLRDLTHLAILFALLRVRLVELFDRSPYAWLPTGFALRDTGLVHLAHRGDRVQLRSDCLHLFHARRAIITADLAFLLAFLGHQHAVLVILLLERNFIRRGGRYRYRYYLWLHAKLVAAAGVAVLPVALRLTTRFVDHDVDLVHGVGGVRYAV
jgi:hypothetical protein